MPDYRCLNPVGSGMLMKSKRTNSVICSFLDRFTDHSPKRFYMKLISLLAMGIGITVFSACNNASNGGKSDTASISFDTKGMDTSIRAGDDFFHYANGAWMKTTVIPDDQSGWGSFYTLYEDNQKKLRSILEESIAANPAKGSLEQKVGDYYASGMDTVAIEKLGADPLKPALAKIDAVKDYKELITLLTELSKNEEAELIGLYVGADEKNSAQNIAIFGCHFLTGNDDQSIVCT